MAAGQVHRASRENPFRASIGATPPLLVGREDAVEDFADALDEAPGVLERISLFTGARGVGKTCVLNAVEDEAKTRGWHVFSQSADPGFMAALSRQVPQAIEQLGGDTSRRRLSGFSFRNLGANIDVSETVDWTAGLRELLEILDDLHDQFGTGDPAGTLITLDEVHATNVAELRSFATVIQHLVRADVNIAVAMAGIPSAVETLVDDRDGDNTVTFIRRADRITLGRVSDKEVRRALREPVESVGSAWEDAALAQATGACGGYPFMIQLVGHFSVKHSDGELITGSDVEAGIARARRKLGTLVLDPALNDLSPMDRKVLSAMSRDDGPSLPRAVADRLGVELNYLYVYRRRLVTAGMIRQTEDGRLDLAVPYLREHLRELEN